MQFNAGRILSSHRADFLCCSALPFEPPFPIFRRCLHFHHNSAASNRILQLGLLLWWIVDDNAKQYKIDEATVVFISNVGVSYGAA